jgi:hypothetical protein
MAWLETNRRLDPNTPQAVHCDSAGVATLNVGITVTFSPGTRASEADASITCFVVDPALGDTTTVGTSIGIRTIIGGTYNMDGALQRAVRGTTYTVDPGESSAIVSPLRSGRETASVVRVALEGIGEEDIVVTWLLPTTLRNDSDRTIPVSFSTTAGRIVETGARFDPHVPDTAHINSNCAVTLDLGFTVTVPEGTPPGRFSGGIIGSAVYIGNRHAPSSTEPIEAEYFITVDVTDEEIPTGHVLAQNYPNPFNAGTVFSYFLPHPEAVTLTIVDLLGQNAATVFDGYQTAGWHEVRWQAKGLASGVYFSRLQAGNALVTRKLLYLR